MDCAVVNRIGYSCFPQSRNGLVPPPFRTEGRALVVTMPAQGIDPSWLAQPLEALGFSPLRDVHALRLAAANGSRWRSVDAAFLTRVLNELRGRSPHLALIDLPEDLQKLLEQSDGTWRAA